jgi:hypothetical protein
MTDDASEPEKKTLGVSFVMPASEREALEEWVHQNRIKSVGAAVRCMIRFALANGVKPDDEPDLRRKAT